MADPPSGSRRPTPGTYTRRRIAALVALLAALGTTAAIVLATRTDDPPDSPPPAEIAGGAGSETDGSATQPEEGWRRHRGPVPILMYHDTAAPPPDAPFPELHVPTQDFRAQMRWLAEHGYRAVTMAQVLDAWEGDGLLPRRPVVVSFDDGFRSHHSKALPILSELGWPGVLNLQVHSEKGLPDDAALSPEMVEEMIAAGWELASHTISHADLTTVDDAQLESEVAGSRKALQRQFDVPVDHFCYPAGKYDDAVVGAVQRAGYSSAATVDDGVASSDEPYTLERIRINGSDGVEGFAEKIEAAEA